MPNRLSAWTILFTFIGGCAGSDPIKQEAIVGQWIVSQVDYDGMDQPDWKGAHLTFQQDIGKEGNFSMADTRYDSIWSSNGTWRITTLPSELVFNDTLRTNFQVDGDKLIIAMHLPSTERSTCTDDKCIPIVTGEWMFKFHKD